MTYPDDAGMLHQLMTSREMATHLAMPRSTVDDYARRGVIPSIKIGRHRRFIRGQVEEALRRLWQGEDREAG